MCNGHTWSKIVGLTPRVNADKREQSNPGNIN